MNKDINFFFNKKSKWQDEYLKLREIATATPLEEEVKWGKPCYTLNGQNIFLIHGFKDYCALLFHKGVLLADTENLLIQQTENVQAARQLRFTSLKEIQEKEEIITAYIFEAIEVEKAGLQVEYKKTKEYEVPEEFQKMLEDDPAINDAFKSLTPGRQRGYLLYFGSAKQSKTRISRIEKYLDKIMEGKGMDD